MFQRRAERDRAGRPTRPTRRGYAAIHEAARYGRAVALAMATWGALAQAAAAAQNVDAAPADRLPLWEVTHEGNTVYLLGSIHRLRADAYPLDGAFDVAFDRARTVVFELDFREMMAGAALMLERGLYFDGRTLRTVLPETLYAETAERLGRLGLPPAITDRMKPWLAAMMISTEEGQRAGFDAAAGVDLHFFERAVAAGKDIYGLETTQDQMAVFDGLDEAAQVELLRSTLAELETSAAQLDELTAMWRRGDTEALAQRINQSLATQPQLLERVLYQRNRNWIPMIESMLRAPDPGLVIVGVGHLVGDGSVVELLRARGYGITQMTTTR